MFESYELLVRVSRAYLGPKIRLALAGKSASTETKGGRGKLLPLFYNVKRIKNNVLTKKWKCHVFGPGIASSYPTLLTALAPLLKGAVLAYPSTRLKSIQIRTIPDESEDKSKAANMLPFPPLPVRSTLGSPFAAVGPPMADPADPAVGTDPAGRSPLHSLH